MADFRRSTKIRSYFCQNFHKTEIKALKGHHRPPYCHSASERGENSESDQTKSRYRYVSAKDIKIIEITWVPKFW